MKLPRNHVIINNNTKQSIQKLNWVRRTIINMKSYRPNVNHTPKRYFTIKVNMF